MKTTRFFTHSSPLRKRITATTLMLALTLASGPLLATGKTDPGAPSAQASNTVHDEEPSSSRINGRADWDIDYPSQLAPQFLPPSRKTPRPTTITLSGSVDSSSTEWQHPLP